MTPDQTPAPAETPKPGPSNLQLRTIYGLLGAALLVGSVWFSPWTFGLFFAFVQAVMLWEFYRMMRAGGYAPAVGIGLVISLLMFGATLYVSNYIMGSKGILAEPTQHEGVGELITISFWRSQSWTTFFAIPGGLLLITTVLIVIREMFFWPNHSQPFANVAATLTGLLYISLPMTALIMLAFMPYGYDYRRVIVLLFLIWSSDIGAYAAGKTFGKHKLAPKISPGKTWEGFAGGVVLTLVMGWALGYLIPELPLAHRLVAAGVVAVFGPLGDLAESMLKRSVGMKDSGSIMPGHGGLLDRFDAFLLVLPVLVLLRLLVG
ncbi:phosphatidate cytidylyltransferase [Hymenobacter sp. ASUV-10]|uniref:Phosphatidate cytidylyltransferase n=1 Tax=Hymenobacter aranciens TaxID=3063996 RepID=A0ABT9BB43_9BACT|nr:phosphatidate cytidylyltransferase [Hymenobacter sp. ASUV-10]MDO7874853.1 phosphatidate cytidylyltransferase [Hymenobacter sp. ASUV-10]